MHAPNVAEALNSAREKTAEALAACRQAPEKLGPTRRTDIESALTFVSGALDAQIPDMRAKIEATRKLLRRRFFPRGESFGLYSALADVVFTLDDLITACANEAYPETPNETDDKTIRLDQSSVAITDYLQKIDRVVDDIARSASPLPGNEIQNELIEYVSQHIAHSSGFAQALFKEEAVDFLAVDSNLTSLVRTARDFVETVKPDYARVSGQLKVAADRLFKESVEISKLIADSKLSSNSNHRANKDGEHGYSVETQLERLMRERIRRRDPNWMDVRTPSSRFSIEIAEQDALKIFLSEALGSSQQHFLDETWALIDSASFGRTDLVLRSIASKSNSRSRHRRAIQSIIREKHAWDNPRELLRLLVSRAQWVGALQGNSQFSEGALGPKARECLVYLSFLPSDAWIPPIVYWLDEVQKRLPLDDGEEFFLSYLRFVVPACLSGVPSYEVERIAMHFVDLSLHGLVFEDKSRNRFLTKLADLISGRTEIGSSPRLLAILKTVEYSRTQKNNDELSQAVIEHIAPRHITQSTLFGEKFLRDARPLTMMLGNVTLSEARNYRELGNMDFEYKKEYYAGSPFQITREIASEHDWDGSAILRRTVKLASQACVAWGLPSQVVDIINDHISRIEKRGRYAAD